MTVTKDASSPAPVLTNATTAVTSASFSPPAGSYILACCSLVGGTIGQTTPSWKVDDSSSATNWSSPTIQEEQSGVVVAQIFTKYFATAPGSITVTLTQTANIQNSTKTDLGLQVLVYTGAATSQTGAGTNTDRVNGAIGTDNFTWANDPTTVNSLIAVMVTYFTTGTATWTDTANANTTTYNDNQDTVNTDGGFLTGQQTGLTTSGNISSPLTTGWNSNVSPHLGLGFAGVTLEILPSTVTNVTVNLQCAQVNVEAISPTVTIGSSKTVNLLTAQVNVAADPPTITSTSETSGGFGTPGQIKITYLSPLVEALSYSISATKTTDAFGNQLPVGYQGPLSAIEPGSSPAVTEFWHSLALTSANCSASGNGVNGFFYQYTPDNEVELVWDLTLTGSGSLLATLPSAYCPLVPQNIITSWYGTGPVAYSNSFSPHLLISTVGAITINNYGALAISVAGRVKITLDVV